MRRAKIFKEESGRWVVEYIGPDGAHDGVSWMTWAAAVADAVRWVDFR